MILYKISKDKVRRKKAINKIWLKISWIYM